MLILQLISSAAPNTTSSSSGLWFVSEEPKLEVKYLFNQVKTHRDFTYRVRGLQHVRKERKKELELKSKLKTLNNGLLMEGGVWKDPKTVNTKREAGTISCVISIKMTKSIWEVCSQDVDAENHIGSNPNPSVRNHKPAVGLTGQPVVRRLTFVFHRSSDGTTVYSWWSIFGRCLWSAAWRKHWVWNTENKNLIRSLKAGSWIKQLKRC